LVSKYGRRRNHDNQCVKTNQLFLVSNMMRYRRASRHLLRSGSVLSSSLVVIHNVRASQNFAIDVPPFFSHFRCESSHPTYPPTYLRYFIFILDSVIVLLGPSSLQSSLHRISYSTSSPRRRVSSRSTPAECSVKRCGPDDTTGRTGWRGFSGLWRQRFTKARRVGRHAQMMATLISIEDQTAAPTLLHVKSVDCETL